MFSSTTALIWKGHTNLSKPSLPELPSLMSETDTARKKPARNANDVNGPQQRKRIDSSARPTLSLVPGLPSKAPETIPDFVASYFASISLPSGRSPQQHNHSFGVCPACRALEIESMQDFTELAFSEAFSMWFKMHSEYIAPGTIHIYKQYGNALTAFFGPLQIKNIGIGQLRGFQIWRSKNHAPESPIKPHEKYQHAASSIRIKNEINGVLKPILREAGLWADIEQRKFNHFQVSREGSGTPLSTVEQDMVLEVAFSKKKWMIAAHCQRIMYRTGTLFGELRKVRRKHVDLKRGTVEIIEGAKNAGSRVRTVRLVPSALESIHWLVVRYEKMGGDLVEQYILPHRTKGFNVPMGSTYRSWRAIIDATIEKHKDNHEFCAKLELTRQCDGRTSAACILLKNSKLSLPTIEKALGWSPSSAMRKRYYKADHDTQLDALMTLESAK